jgi:hypothetical protein
MKKIVFTLTFLAFAGIVYAQWQHCSGMNEVSVYTLNVHGNNIYAGTVDSGVYRSTNNGTSWVQTSITLNNKDVNALATLGNYIFAGTWGYGVYLSTNNGINWTQSGLNNLYLNSLAVCGNNVFAGTDGDGIYLSANYGTSWIQTGFNYYGYILTLTSSGNNVFASREGYGIYLSANYGGSWTYITPETTSVFNIVYAIAVSGNNIFAGTYGHGIYLSPNYGTTWINVKNNDYIMTIATLGNNIFAGGAGDGCCVYVSTNNGTTWVTRIEGLGVATSEIYSLCILNDYIFAGTDYGVYRRPLAELIGIKQISELVPSKYSLFQNYPNPFNPTTKIRFSLPSHSEGGIQDVKLVIFDVLGREIATLVNEQLKPGTYETDWDASNYPSGVYFYKLQAGEFTSTKKLMLIK